MPCMACSTRSAFRMARSSARSFSPAARRAWRCPAARRPGAVEHGASRGAGARRLSRAHHALFRRCSARARIPVALSQSPADPADDPQAATATRCQSQEIRSGYEEAFIEELKGFWSASRRQAVRNTAGAGAPRHGAAARASPALSTSPTTRSIQSATTGGLAREGPHRHQPDHLDQ